MRTLVLIEDAILDILLKGKLSSHLEGIWPIANIIFSISWGSGTVEYPYLVAPADAIKTQASKDGTRMVSSTTDSTSAGASAAAQADTAIVFITADSGEGYITVEGNAGDRNNLDPWHSG